MKKFTFCATLLAGVLAGTLTSCNNASQTSAMAPMAMCDSLRLPVAYVNIDSLLVNYEFAKDLNEELMSKTEEARASINSKAQALEKEVAEFQRKVQTNAFLSEDRARSEQERLMKKKEELDKLNYDLQNDLAQQQAQMNVRLNDTIRNFMKAFNEKMHFELIFTNTMNDNLLIDNPKYDITADVLKQLNERYAKAK